MVAITRIDSQPAAFVPAPLTEEEAGAMFRAAVALFRRWGVTDEQAAVLLDTTPRTFARWKAGAPGRTGRDQKDRLANLMGIHKALRIVFGDPARGYAWVKAPNDAFGGASAMEVMLGGGLTDLLRVRRLLDAARGGW